MFAGAVVPEGNRELKPTAVRDHYGENFEDCQSFALENRDRGDQNGETGGFLVEFYVLQLRLFTNVDLESFATTFNKHGVLLPPRFDSR